MGVPNFIPWCYNKFNNCYTMYKNNINNVNILYIDANCFIHPQAKIICSLNQDLLDNDNIDLLEKKIFKQILYYIQLLIDIINPSDLVYIAIDGVAPMAKIKHQRIRRFKTIYDKMTLINIAKKHNKKIYKEWNTSAITPGTKFMENLTKEIITWIDNNKTNKCKIIFSSSYSSGEGEHKILQHIKQNNNDKINTVIYGLDTDLIFLSLASHKKNIYLMREKSEIEVNSNNTSGFSYISIDTLRNVIAENMIINVYNIEIINDENKKKIINDFIFLCYLGGNDFIPHIPSLNIKPHNNNIINGVDTLLETYIFVKKNNNMFLINDMEININFLIELFDILSKKEEEYFNSIYKNQKKLYVCKNNDLYEIDKYNYEENIIENYIDTIQFCNPNKTFTQCKSNYYNYYFESDNYSIKKKINEEYFKGLIWTIHYYFDKCKDYEWYYPYHHAPFISDLKDYLLNINNINIIKQYEKLYSIGIWFNEEINPIQQLLLVLPYESSYLIPKKFRNILFNNKILKYFPHNILDIKIDYLFKKKSWQNILMIDIIPAITILKLTNHLFDLNYHYHEYIVNN